MSYDDPNCEECNEERRARRPQGPPSEFLVIDEAMNLTPEQIAALKVHRIQNPRTPTFAEVQAAQMEWIRAKREADAAKLKELARSITPPLDVTDFDQLKKAAHEAAREMSYGFPQALKATYTVQLGVAPSRPVSTAVFHYFDECARVLSRLCGFRVVIDVATGTRPSWRETYNPEEAGDGS